MLVRHALAPKVEEVAGLMVEVVGPPMVEEVGLVEEVDGAVDTKLPVPCELRPLYIVT